MFRVEVFETGWKVFQEGEMGRSFYVIASGKLSVTNTDDTGKVHLLTNLETNLEVKKEASFFGEIALLRGDFFRTATVTAIETSTLLVLTQKRFYQVKSLSSSLLLTHYTFSSLLFSSLLLQPLLSPYAPHWQLTFSCH